MKHIGKSREYNQMKERQITGDLKTVEVKTVLRVEKRQISISGKTTSLWKKVKF